MMMHGMPADSIGQILTMYIVDFQNRHRLGGDPS